MLEGLVHRKQDLARLEASPARDYLGPFATALLAKGYRHRTIVRYVFSADRLARWLRRHGQVVQELDEPAFAAYLLELGRRRRCRLAVSFRQACLNSLTVRGRAGATA
jgi:hypothetical protein